MLIYFKISFIKGVAYIVEKFFIYMNYWQTIIHDLMILSNTYLNLKG